MRVKAILVLTVLLLVSETSIPILRAEAQGPTPNRGDSLSLIQEAYEQGSLDYETALLYKVYALKSPARLPARFRTGPPSRYKCGNPVFDEVRKNWGILSPKAQAEIEPLLSPPFPELTQILATQHFLLHYTVAPQSEHKTTDEYVSDLGSWFEYAWGIEVPTDVLSYGEPGGPFTTTIHVWVYKTFPYAGSTSENGYVEVSTELQENEQKITAAHELFHTIQYAYTGAGGGWLREASAVWMEDVVHDDLDDYLQYLPWWFERPDRPLDSELEYHYYGDSIFLKYLSTKYGAGDNLEDLLEKYLVKSIWQSEGLKKWPDDPLKALDSVLQNEREPDGTPSSFLEAFEGFTVCNYRGSPDRALYYQDDAADRYPNVAIQGFHRRYPVEITRTLTIGHLASNYIQFVPDKAWSPGGTLEIAFSIMKGRQRDFGVYIVKERRGGGQAEVEKMTFTSGKSAKLAIPGFGTTFYTATMVVGCLGTNPQNSCGYRYEAEYRTWYSGGPAGTIVTILAADPSSPGVVYAGTTNGVYKTTDGGYSWARIGLAGSDVRALAAGPQVVYAGTLGLGVFKSEDGGGTWRPVNAGIPADSWVFALAMDPQQARTVYAGSSGTGAYRTTNGGALWAVKNTGLEGTRLRISRMLVDPGDRRTVYATLWGDGIYRSTDGGDHWIAINGNLSGQALYAYAIAVGPGRKPQDRWLYLGTHGAGVFRSTDGGQSWEPFSAGLGDLYNQSLVVHPEDDTLYVATSSHGVYVWDSDSGTWVPLGQGPGTPYVNALALDADDGKVLYAGTNDGVWQWAEVVAGAIPSPRGPSLSVPEPGPTPVPTMGPAPTGGN